MPVERLQKLQNRAVWIVTYSDFNTRSLRLLDDLGWDTLEQRRAKPHTDYVYPTRFQASLPNGYSSPLLV